MAVRRVINGVAAATAVLLGLLSWSSAPGYSAGEHDSDVKPHADLEALVLSGEDGERRRQELLRRATFWHDPVPQQWPALDECTFFPDEPSGTTPKFDCVFPNGEVLKVKYGRNPELHAEVAATNLLHALGYGADYVTFSPRLRCHGCPRFPFVAMHAATRLRWLGLPHLSRYGYTDFEWVAVERKLDRREIETPTVEGWAWWELRRSQAPKAELHAFYLLAVFLGHWDNKSTNQRLVCRDEACSETLAMIQDAGATFGPRKVNLAAWRSEPIWADREACRVSMSRLPFSGATFQDVTISEEGRALLAAKLSRLSDDDVRRILSDARFGEFHPGTDDRRDLNAWEEAFKYRVDQIVNTTCPASPESTG